MNAALRAAQWAHDSAEPEAAVAFIDTAEGSAWAEEAVATLLAGKPLVVAGQEVIKPFGLAHSLGELACDAFDPDDQFSAMILYAATGQGDKARACFEAFMGSNFVESLAYEMAAPHAEAYAAAQGDTDHD